MQIHKNRWVQEALPYPIRSGLRKIRDAEYPCTHPEHDPPKHMVYEPGTYEYICPACGKKTVFEVPAIVW